jgi:hypothetical protein
MLVSVGYTVLVASARVGIAFWNYVQIPISSLGPDLWILGVAIFLPRPCAVLAPTMGTHAYMTGNPVGDC